MKKKIYVVGDAYYYASFIENYELVSRIEDATHIIFTGGEDVDPSFYNEKKNIKTFSNVKRDLTEQKIFNKISPSQIVIGICRGLN